MAHLRCRYLAIVVVFSTMGVFDITKPLYHIAAGLSKMQVPSGDLQGNTRSTRPVEFVELWNEYVSQHSEEALRNDFGQNGTLHGQSQRKFAIGYYSCPLQAGNRIHHFMNSLLWAIITNRTLLWKYYDNETCVEVGRGFDGKICQSANTEADCANVLKRADFLPSYDFWSTKLDLPPPHFLPYWSTGVRLTSQKYWYEGVENDIKPGLVDTSNETLVVFPQMLGQAATHLVRQETRERLLSTSSAKERVNRLLSENIDFIYGYLFFNSFSFQSNISVPPQLPEKATTNVEIGIVLHSRHEKVADDGSNIEREITCLHKILSGTQGSCQVSLLSDRPNTIENVSLFLAAEYPHCMVLVAPHDAGESFKMEHGPFAGVGFYQDLALVSNQTLHVPTLTSAYIGSSSRSSAQLVEEVMTYQLRQRYNFSGELLTCYYGDIRNQTLNKGI